MTNQLQELWRAHQSARSEFLKQEELKRATLVARIRANLDGKPVNDVMDILNYPTLWAA